MGSNIRNDETVAKETVEADTHPAKLTKSNKTMNVLLGVAAAVIAALLIGIIVEFITLKSIISALDNELLETQAQQENMEHLLAEKTLEYDAKCSELNDVYELYEEALNASAEKDALIAEKDALFNEIADFFYSSEAGWANQKLYANDKLVFLHNNGERKYIKVTDKYSNGSVYFEAEGPIGCEWSMEWESSITKLYIYPAAVGTGYIRIYHNDASFRVMVVVLP